MQVSDQFLNAMGLEGLEGKARAKALDDILYILNMRVARRISGLVSKEQASEFERLCEYAAAEEIAIWLDKNVPSRAQIIEEEAQKMRDETQTLVNKVMRGAA